MPHDMYLLIHPILDPDSIHELVSGAELEEDFDTVETIIEMWGEKVSQALTDAKIKAAVLYDMPYDEQESVLPGVVCDDSWIVAEADGFSVSAAALEVANQAAARLDEGPRTCHLAGTTRSDCVAAVAQTLREAGWIVELHDVAIMPVPIARFQEAYFELLDLGITATGLTIPPALSWDALEHVLDVIEGSSDPASTIDRLAKEYPIDETMRQSLIEMDFELESDLASAQNEIALALLGDSEDCWMDGTTLQMRAGSFGADIIERAHASGLLKLAGIDVPLIHREQDAQAVEQSVTDSTPSLEL